MEPAIPASAAKANIAATMRACVPSSSPRQDRSGHMGLLPARASVLIPHGADEGLCHLKVIQVLTGHTNYIISMDIYAYADIAAKQYAAEALVKSMANERRRQETAGAGKILNCILELQ